MLDYDLSQRGEKSLYDYLYQRIRDDITTGALVADDRLPSKRELARRLGVSLVTVEGAYAQLVAEGWVRSRPRSGFFVNELPGASAVAGHRTASRREAAAVEADADAEEQPGEVDLAAAHLWSRALRATLAAEPEREVFSAPPAQGAARLRDAIASHLRRVRGLEVDPALVVVGAGAQVLDNMVAQLLGCDLTYGVEDPGYLRLTRIYRANGARVRHIPLDGQGVRADLLEPSGVDVLHLMPSHQFPTGRVTSVPRRYELLGWASAGGHWIVEDDYDCEFRLSGRPVPPLASMDAAGRVIYTNTFSRGLGPALRLAYMVLPPDLMDRWKRDLGFYSSTLSSVDQLALARILEDGSYERHVNRMRKRHRDLRDLLVESLRECAGPDRAWVEESDSGLHLVLAVRSDANEAEVAARAAARGVRLSPLSDHAWLPENREQPDGARRFVMVYGGLGESQVRAAAEAIATSI